LPLSRLDASGKPLVANVENAIVLDPATLAQYVGVYDAGHGAAFTVKSENGGLSVMLTGQSFAPIYPSAPDEFYYTIVDAQITFTRDASGQVVGLVLHQGGQTISATRAPASP
jgi:hypothetical protein